MGRGRRKGKRDKRGTKEGNQGQQVGDSVTLEHFANSRQASERTPKSLGGFRRKNKRQQTDKMGKDCAIRDKQEEGEGEEEEEEEEAEMDEGEENNNAGVVKERSKRKKVKVEEEEEAKQHKTGPFEIWEHVSLFVSPEDIGR